MIASPTPPDIEEMVNRILTDHLTESGKRKKIAEIESKREEKRKKLKSRIHSNSSRDGDEEEDSQLVGILKLDHKRDKREIQITLDRVYWIGRGESCDLVIPKETISSKHLRLYAVKTTTNLSLAVLHDTSINGYILNNETCGISDFTISGKSINTKSRVLRDGDVLKLPGYSGVFTYHQLPNVKFHTQELSDKFQLFPSSNPNLKIEINPWIINNYPLGNGSWGIVNIGKHKKSNNIQVAIKTVEQNFYEQNHIERMKFEIIVHKSLNHLNILKLLDYIIETDTKKDNNDNGHSTDQDYDFEFNNGDRNEGSNPLPIPRIHMILEMVTGGDLWSYIDKHHHLEENEVRWIGWQMISGLKYLHEKGIAHRDIKPENILLHTSCAYPRILIGDLGSSTSKLILFSQLSVGNQHKRHNTSQGTTEYLPYDQLKGMKNEEYNPESTIYYGERKKFGEEWWREECGMDIWATGVTLYFCASHNPPYCHIGPEDVRYYGRNDTLVPRRNGRKMKDQAMYNEESEDIFMEDTPIYDSIPEVDVLVDDPIDDYPTQEPMDLTDGNLNQDEDHIDEVEYIESEDQVSDTVELGLNNHFGELDLSSQKYFDEEGQINNDRYVRREHTPESRQTTVVPHRPSNNYDNCKFDEILHQMEVFKLYGPDYWPEVHAWSKWSKEGKRFIDDLICLNPQQRIQSSNAHDHPWFENNKDELDEIYQKVMVRGEVIRWLI